MDTTLSLTLKSSVIILIMTGNEYSNTILVFDISINFLNKCM